MNIKNYSYLINYPFQKEKLVSMIDLQGIGENHTIKNGSWD